MVSQIKGGDSERGGLDSLGCVAFWSLPGKNNIEGGLKMSRYLRFLLLVMLAVGLIASGAWAGTFKVNKGAATTPVNVAVEALGSNRNVTIAGASNNGVSNVAMSYTLGTSMTSGDLLQVVFTGASFRATTYNVCAQNINNTTPDINIGSKTFSAITTSTNIPLAWSSNNVGANAGNYLVITDGTCGAGTPANIALSIDSTTSTGFKTVSGNLLSSGGLVKDEGTSANVANVMSQYSYDSVLASNTYTIDYLAGAANGSQFEGSSNNAGTANALNITVNNVDYTAGTGAQNAGLTVATLINVQDSQAWQGVSKLFLTASGAGCAVSSNLGTSAYTATPSGTVNLNVPSASFNAATTASTAFDLCVITSGNAALNPRTITGSVDVNVTGTGANDKSASSYQTIQTWNVNAYQGIIPYIYGNPTYKTICVIDNTDTSKSASILLDVMSSTSATVLANQSIGSVAAMSTKRVDFDTSVTPYTTGTSETAETPIALTGLESKRYSAKLTVTGNANKIFMNCMQVDPAGSKRAVPVLTNVANTNWLQ
jgi:hypothetical protein